MARPALFLDIDGVLNNTPSLVAAAHREDGITTTFHVDPTRPVYQGPDTTEVLDPACVEELNRVVAATDCAVIVSSTWRLIRPLHRIARCLRGAGYRYSLLSTTPDSGPHRGAEIEAWLAQNPEFKTFAIVDDDSDMGAVAHRHVKTSFEVGLTRESADSLIALLTEPVL